MRSFLGFGQAAYIGTPQTTPIKLGGIGGSAVPLLFQWLSYGGASAKPNINVLVNLETASCIKLDQIRSVYVDNLGSNNPVYVYFPDTSYTVVAKPNSEGWYPVNTNARVFWVIGEGFIDNFIPQTLVMVSNIPSIPAVNVEIDQTINTWKASPTITRGNIIYNSNFGVPALGDQMQATIGIDLTVGGNTVGLWGTPYASGFLYLQQLQFILIGVTGGVGVFGQSAIESTGISGQLIAPLYAANNLPGNQIFFNLQGMNVKLDATQTWRFRVINPLPAGASGQIFSSFTQSPI